MQNTIPNAEALRLLAELSRGLDALRQKTPLTVEEAFEGLEEQK